jgi:rod shape determining protein RodA
MTVSKKRLDLTTFSVFISLLIIGWLMVYSVSYEEIQSLGLWESDAGKQLVWIGISLLVFFIITLIDWKFWQTLAFPLYGIGVFLLISVLFFGTTIKGAQSWFVLGGFSFQPSEVAKATTALGLAGYLSLYKTSLKDLKSIALSSLIYFIPAFLVLLQPDAGSTVVFFSFLIVQFREGLNPAWYLAGIGFLLILLFGLFFSPILLTIIIIFSILILLGIQIQIKNSGRYFILLLLLATIAYLGINAGFEFWILAIVSLVLIVLNVVYQKFFKRLNWTAIYLFIALGSGVAHASNYAFNELLKPHQQERIDVWLRPERCDPKGSLYNVIQSKMAIGSGGLSGKGFNQGTLTNLNYIPEQSTDFIFCTIGEEQGFLGTTSIIGLFIILLYRLTQLGERQRSNFSRQFIYGFTSILFIHVFINIAMTMGLMPIIGIPLPFISKGGSALLGLSIMMAISLKLDSQRFNI